MGAITDLPSIRRRIYRHGEGEAHVDVEVFFRMDDHRAEFVDVFPCISEREIEDLKAWFASREGQAQAFHVKDIRHKASILNLSLLAYSNGHTHWHYNGSPHDAESPEYFDSVGQQMRGGDMLTVSNLNGEGAIFFVSKGIGSCVNLKRPK